MQNAKFDPFPAERETDLHLNIWARGLSSVVFLILFALAESLLAVLALVQFFWMLITRDRNRALVDFGAAMGRWMSEVARFQAAETDERPFPWAPWPAD